ncbi:MAG: RagB/SusD family nutrient uptake outer membrane protein [Anditalea sp.]
MLIIYNELNDVADLLPVNQTEKGRITKGAALALQSRAMLYAHRYKDVAVELAYEGLRYFDIRRWKIAEDVIPGIIYGMTYTEENGGVANYFSSRIS